MRLPLRPTLALLVVALALVALIASPPAQAADCLHIVQPGETVSSIAARYCLPPNDLVVVNKLPDPNNVPAGTWLVIPNCGQCATLPSAPTATPVSSAAQFTAALANWPRLEVPIGQYSLLALLGAPPAPPPLPPQVSAAVDAATVQVLVATGSSTVTGSGVVIGSDGHTILTTYGLVSDPTTGALRSPVVIFVGPFLNFSLRADVLATDAANDLAVLRVLPTPGFTGFAYLTLADSDRVELAAPVYVYGYGQGQTAGLHRATGLVSGIVTDTISRQRVGLTTDAAMPAGTTSGFAVNSEGQVIGPIALAPRIVAAMHQSGLPLRTLLVPSNIARAQFQPVIP